MVTHFTTTGSHWNNFLNDPFFIGFGPNVQTWTGVTRQESYPPYNLVKVDEETYRVDLALAGFDKKDVDVTVDNGTLIIKGEVAAEDTAETLHKGIATRKFTRSFALGEFMEVTGAEFKNGMLAVTVERIVPEEKKPKTIKIK
jgi:molecular chaperone IbpA